MDIIPLAQAKPQVGRKLVRLRGAAAHLTQPRLDGAVVLDCVSQRLTQALACPARFIQHDAALRSRHCNGLVQPKPSPTTHCKLDCQVSCCHQITGFAQLCRLPSSW